MSGSVNPCVFCGQTGKKLSNEHVLPGWLNDVFKSVGMTGDVELRWRGDVARTSRSLDIQLRVVCTDCNGGWMSELENEFRTLMRDAITGEAALPGREIVLRGDAQTVVATWAVKTWLLLEVAGEHLRRGAITSPPTLRFLHDERRPPNQVQVLIGATNPPDRQAVVFRTALVQPDDGPPTGVMALLVVGTLALVMYGPNVSETGERLGFGVRLSGP